MKMNIFKRTTVILIALFSISVVTAQSSKDLIGKWKTTYEYEENKGEVTYEFKFEDKKLKAYSTKIKGDENYQTADNTLVMDKISFKNGKGEANFFLEYEGEKYEVKAELTLKDKNTLKVAYSYYNYSNTEVWKRIK